jgi:hypothetical protein
MIDSPAQHINSRNKFKYNNYEWRSSTHSVPACKFESRNSHHPIAICTGHVLYNRGRREYERSSGQSSMMRGSRFPFANKSGWKEEDFLKNAIHRLDLKNQDERRNHWVGQNWWLGYQRKMRLVDWFANVTLVCTCFFHIHRSDHSDTVSSDPRSRHDMTYKTYIYK